MHMIFGGNPGSSKRRRIIHWWSIFSARRDRYYDIASGNGKPQRGCHCDICRVPGTYAGVPWQKSRYAVQNCISGEIWGLLQPELPGREECIGISSGNSMHKAGGECLTWDSCEIPAEEEERVDSQRKDRFEYQFFRIPCIWRQIFRRWKRCRMRSREHTGFAGEAETIDRKSVV